MVKVLTFGREFGQQGEKLEEGSPPVYTFEKELHHPTSRRASQW